jgi:hypothetical protein
MTKEIVGAVNKLVSCISRTEIQIDKADRIINLVNKAREITENDDSLSPEEKSTSIKEYEEALESARETRSMADENRNKLDKSFKDVIEILKRYNNVDGMETNDIVCTIYDTVSSLEEEIKKDKEALLSNPGEKPDSDTINKIREKEIKKEVYQSVIDAFEGLEIIQKNPGGK